MKQVALILVIATVVFGATAWTVPLLDANPRLTAFVLSDAFFPALFGGIAVSIVAAIGVTLLLSARLTGRPVPEGGA